MAAFRPQVTPPCRTSINYIFAFCGRAQTCVKLRLVRQTTQGLLGGALAGLSFAAAGSHSQEFSK